MIVTNYFLKQILKLQFELYIKVLIVFKGIKLCGVGPILEAVKFACITLQISYYTTGVLYKWEHSYLWTEVQAYIVFMDDS